MAWTYRAAGTAANGNNATSLNPGLPSGWQPGDLCIVQFQNFGGTNARTPSISGGWTGVANSNGYFSNGTSRHGTWYRVLQSGDTAPTITLSGTGVANDTQLSRTFCVYPGAGKASAYKSGGTGSTNASADNVGPIAGLSSITTTDLLLLSCGKSNDWNGTPTLTGWTLATSLTESVTGNDAGMALLYDVSVSGTIAAVTVTDSGGTNSLGVGSGVMFAFSEVDAVTVDKTDLVLTGATNLKTDIKVVADSSAIAFSGTKVGTSRSFGTGSLAFAGQSLTLDFVESGYTVLVDNASMAFSGQSSSLGTSIQVVRADATLTGQSVTGNIGLAVAKADAALTGGSLALHLDIDVAPAALAFAGSNVLLATASSIPVTAGQLSLTGTIVGTSRSFGIGQLGFTGSVVTLLEGVAYTLAVDSVPLTFAGQNVVMQGPAQGTSLVVDSSPLTFTGTALGTSRSFGVGQLSFTGSDVNYVWPNGIVVERASLTFVGRDVPLGGAGGTGTITADSVNLTFTPSVVELEEAIFLDAGLLTLVGREVLWQPGTLAQYAPLAFTGSVVTLTYVDQYVLPVTSTPLNFIPGDVGYISTDAYTLQVESSTLSFSGADAPSMGIGVLVVENSDFEFTGLQVLFVHQRSMLVEPSPFYFTGSDLTYRYEGSHRVSVQPAVLVLTPGTFGLSVGQATNDGRIDGANSYLIDQARGSVLLYAKGDGYFVISKSAA